MGDQTSQPLPLVHYKVHYLAGVGVRKSGPVETRPLDFISTFQSHDMSDMQYTKCLRAGK